jgi:protocatechuate 3,4-dioxygenase, alpha subunit
MSRIMKHGVTGTQTVGPFPHECWRWGFDAPGSSRAVTIETTVFDGDGAAVPDAIIEAWVPGAQDTAVAGMPGWFRAVPRSDGALHLALPAATETGPAAYITLFARGLLRHQFSAVFLADRAGVESSPLLLQVPEARRTTLLAQAVSAGAYRWQIHLQGPHETVFFDYA